MAERGIIFNGENVCAIQEDRKTQTRRIVKPEWPQRLRHARMMRNAVTGEEQAFFFNEGDAEALGVRCPYGQPGDRLWVRETWCQERDGDGYPLGWLYKADGVHPIAVDGDGYQYWRKDGSEASPWKSPLHMPRKASRITLEIVSVRVERVQSISEEDARAEGVTPTSEMFRTFTDPHRLAFENLWTRIHAKPGPTGGDNGYPWARNPWVWAIEFRRIAQEARAA